MKKFHISILIAFLFSNLLSAQTVTLDNGLAKMEISLNGGKITEVSLNAIDLNPIHEYGHFICFDHFFEIINVGLIKMRLWVFLFTEKH